MRSKRISLTRARALAQECGVAHLIWPILQNDPQLATALGPTQCSDASALQVHLAQKRHFSAPSSHPYMPPTHAFSPHSIRGERPSHAPSNDFTGHDDNAASTLPGDKLSATSACLFNFFSARRGQHGKANSNAWRKSVSAIKPARRVLAGSVQDAKRRHSSSCLGHAQPQLENRRHVGQDLGAAQPDSWIMWPQTAADTLPDSTTDCANTAGEPGTHVRAACNPATRVASPQPSSQCSTAKLDLLSPLLPLTPAPVRECSLSKIASTAPSGLPTAPADQPLLCPASLSCALPPSTEHCHLLEPSTVSESIGPPPYGSAEVGQTTGPVLVGELGSLPVGLPAQPLPLLPPVGPRMNGCIEPNAEAVCMQHQTKTTSPPSSFNAPNALFTLLAEVDAYHP